MELVDGTKEQRPHPEIVMGALENAGIEDDRGLQKLLLYSASPGFTSIQVDNTVFTYIPKAKGEEVEAVAAVFNLEIADGLPRNLLKFLGRIQKRGVTAVTINTIDPNVFRAFVKVQPFLDESGAKAGIWQHKTKNKFLGRVIFGDKLKVEL
jgi:hypothetical protein|tara:strand:- start:2357 stop:2812 length:456 start_codon:yes stop_codon:yes gene_type:complete